jgi:hypothetical protein
MTSWTMEGVLIFTSLLAFGLSAERPRKMNVTDSVADQWLEQARLMSACLNLCMLKKLSDRRPPSSNCRDNRPCSKGVRSRTRSLDRGSTRCRATTDRFRMCASKAMSKDRRISPKRPRVRSSEWLRSGGATFVPMMKPADLGKCDDLAG